MNADDDELAWLLGLVHNGDGDLARKQLQVNHGLGGAEAAAWVESARSVRILGPWDLYRD